MTICFELYSLYLRRSDHMTENTLEILSSLRIEAITKAMHCANNFWVTDIDFYAFA